MMKSLFAIPVTITEPTIEPVSLLEVKNYLGIESTDDSQDLVILSKIIAARMHIEEYLGESIMTQTLEIALQEFEEKIYLPRHPVQSVTSIIYTDENGLDQTFDAAKYTLNQYEFLPYIHLNYDQDWPTHRNQINPIMIRYVAGRATRDDVEQNIKQAMFILLGNWIRHQSETESGQPVFTVPYAAKELLDQARIPRCM